MKLLMLVNLYGSEIIYSSGYYDYEKQIDIYSLICIWFVHTFLIKYLNTRMIILF